ncbi:unnamed protein product [Acanthosepion pharaonis]|uniref:Uncharacterized protein n=1 Tax=Acanthosepion pharaonis TaxID=158019 RepID=A0A812CHX8_ACAPH|nr:unnamed protein product [Sepia pharaonis]
MTTTPAALYSCSILSANHRLDRFGPISLPYYVRSVSAASVSLSVSVSRRSVFNDCCASDGVWYDVVWECSRSPNNQAYRCKWGSLTSLLRILPGPSPSFCHLMKPVSVLICVSAARHLCQMERRAPPLTFADQTKQPNLAAAATSKAISSQSCCRLQQQQLADPTSVSAASAAGRPNFSSSSSYMICDKLRSYTTVIPRTNRLQQCRPCRPSLFLSADVLFTKGLTYGDRLDLDHRCSIRLPPSCPLETWKSSFN